MSCRLHLCSQRPTYHDIHKKPSMLQTNHNQPDHNNEQIHSSSLHPLPSQQGHLEVSNDHQGFRSEHKSHSHFPR